MCHCNRRLLYLDVEAGSDDGGDAVLSELAANVERRRHGALADLEAKLTNFLISTR